jgi:peptidoglycan/xylan/chitin deacetylase (PgdA/CDA1 family)
MFQRWWALFILVTCSGALSGVLHFAYQKTAPDVAQEQVEAAAGKTTPTPDPTSTPSPLLASPPFAQSGEQARILMYHYIRTVDAQKDPLGYRLSVSPQEFEHQLITLKEMGYTSATMRDLAQGKGGPKTVVLTFDDAYEDFYSVAWPLLQKHGLTATVYVITNLTGDRYVTWDQIRELHAAGIEIGAHTERHRELNKLGFSDQRQEIFGSKATIEREIGAQVFSFCYPVGRYNDTAVALVKEAGYANATTTESGVVRFEDNPYLLKRVRINPGYTGEAFARYLR